MIKYDTYKDSRVEWIGEIPSHWQIMPFKRRMKMNNGADYKDWVTDEGYPVIGSGGQFAFASKFMYDGEVVLLGRKGTIDRPLYFNGPFWAVDTMFYAVPDKRVYCKYMYYQALTFPFNYYATATALPSMTQTELGNNPICVPPYDEQRAIADYLDSECTKIDNLIAKEEKRVSLLEEARQSIIAKAVTKGINPDSEMKESGVFWIGATPKSWTVKRLRFTGESKNGLTYTPSDICSEEEGILILRSSNIQNNKLSFDDNVYVKKYDNRLLVEQGDVIICSRNGSLSLVGKSVYIDSPIKATFGAFMLRYRSCENTEYAYYMVSTAVKMYKALFSTTTVNQLIIGDFKDMVVSIPPLEEQQRIVSYIKDNTSWIENKIAMSKKQIDLLKEYKQSLITEVVTGKRKVC